MPSEDSLEAILKRAEEKYWGENDYHAAAAIYGEAVRVAEAVENDIKLGKTGSSTLTIRDNRADSLAKAGKYRLAMRCNEETLKRRIGPAPFNQTHPDILETPDTLETPDILENRRRLASNYSRLDQHNEAVQQYSIVHTAVKKHINHETDKTAWEDYCVDSNNLSSMLFKTKNHKSIASAIDISNDALRKSQGILGKDHAKVIWLRSNLGQALAKLGKYQDAADVFEQNSRLLKSSSSLEQISDETSKILQGSKERLGSCRRKLREMAEKQARLKQLEGSKLEPPDDQPKEKEEEEGNTLKHLQEDETKISKNLNKKRTEPKRAKHEEGEIREKVLNVKDTSDRSSRQSQRDSLEERSKRKNSKQKEGESGDKERPVKDESGSSSPHLPVKMQDEKRSEPKKASHEKREGGNKKLRIKKKDDHNSQHQSVETGEEHQERTHNSTKERQEGPKSKPRLRRPDSAASKVNPVEPEREKRPKPPNRSKAPPPEELQVLSPDVQDSLPRKAPKQHSHSASIAEGIASLSATSLSEKSESSIKRSKSTSSRSRISEVENDPSNLQASKENSEVLKTNTIHEKDSLALNMKKKEGVASSEAPKEAGRPIGRAKSESSRKSKIRSLPELSTKISSNRPHSKSNSKFPTRSSPKLEPESSVVDTDNSLKEQSLQGKQQSLIETEKSNEENDPQIPLNSGPASREIIETPSPISNRGKRRKPLEDEVSLYKRPHSTSAPSIILSPPTTQDIKPGFPPETELLFRSKTPQPQKQDLSKAEEAPKKEISVDNLNFPGSWKPEYNDEVSQDTQYLPLGYNETPIVAPKGKAKGKETEVHPAQGVTDTTTAQPISRPWTDMNNTDKWFQKLHAYVHPVIDRYYHHENEDNIKIALLDTGVSRRSKLIVEPEELVYDIKAMSQRVKKGELLKEDLKPNEDSDGHGTDCAYLLWKVCPYADIYPYRICSNKEEPDIGLVKLALEHAVDVLNVDIISMSFGWNRENELLGDVFERASKKGILLFAATSNDGIDIKYPARDDAVFAIDAADSMGVPLGTNPRKGFNRQRFTAVGKDIMSVANFREKPTPAGKPRRKKGTSFATPVAAATAGLLLEFAKQPPLSSWPNVLRWLRTKRGMEHVLTEMFTISHINGFFHIDIAVTFQEFIRDSGYDDGGEYDDTNSPRWEIANQIRHQLRRYFIV